MPSKINEAIPIQSFEVVRQQIGSILAVELESQATLQNDNRLGAKVFDERFAKIDRSEGPVVNVTFVSSVLEHADPTGTRYLCTYHIDCYESSRSTQTKRGDTRSLVRLQKLMGVCRGILQHSKYIRLDLNPPLVLSRNVTGMQIAQPEEFQDALAMTMGRLTLNVQVSQNEGTSEPIELTSWISQVKLEETDKGYIFTQSST